MCEGGIHFGHVISEEAIVNGLDTAEADCVMSEITMAVPSGTLIALGSRLYQMPRRNAPFTRKGMSE